MHGLIFLIFTLFMLLTPGLAVEAASGEVLDSQGRLETDLRFLTDCKAAGRPGRLPVRA